MRRRLVMAVAGLLLGCHVHIRESGRRPPPLPHSPGPPPPTRTHRQALEGTVYAREIKANVVRARVIYCKEIHARTGDVRSIRPAEGKRDWGGDEVRVAELVADTIYAKEIHAGHLEAAVTHCKEVKIGR